MDFFGSTYYGVANPIRDTLKSTYSEPTNPPDLQELIEIAKTKDKPFSQVIKELDVNIGFVDGYAYGSYDKLTKMRSKSVTKPVGPTDMYRVPVIESMKYGWWYGDCKLPQFETDSWYRRDVKNFKIISDMTKFALKARL